MSAPPPRTPAPLRRATLLALLATTAAAQAPAPALAPAPAPAPAHPHPRPNVLILLSDDQGFADIGYHNPNVYSPNLDALAAAGTRFTQHYVMPQCTPTRVALLTGRYPSRFGGAALEASNDPAIPAGTPTLATLFRGAGYDTYLVGKWHLGSTPAAGPNAFDFAHSYGSLAGAVGMYDHRYRKGAFADTWQRDGTLIPGHENGRHATDLVADEAIRVIEAKRSAPFFLYCAFHAVHSPLDERGRFADRPTALDPDDPTRWRDEAHIEWFHDPDGVIQRERDPEKRLLLAAVHHLDAAIGRIVDALERTGQRRDTLILFSSDNGPQVDWPGNAYPDDLKLTDFNQPLPMRGKKTDVYEGGIHVPGFANWPGRVAARAVDVPVHVVDWLPTLAALLGGAGPAPDAGGERTANGGDGVDLGGVLFADAADARLPDRDLYWTWSRPTNRWALRHGDWKIVRYGRGEPVRAQWQLFDLRHDPRETRDVAAEHPDVVDRLHERFVAHRARDRR